MRRRHVVSPLCVKYVPESSTMKQITSIILQQHMYYYHTCSVCNKGFNRLNNKRRHEEKCHQASSTNGIGTKRPLNTQNDNMVLNKREKPSPFTVDVVKRDPDYNPEIVVYKGEDAAGPIH